MGFSSIPLPKVVADVGPGGPIVTAMSGGNALTQQNLENEISRVKAQYAPLTTQAEAASKLAYANLMGPQFLAKLMGHTDILANIPDDQKRQMLGMLKSAGTGGSTGANFLSQFPMQQQPQSPLQNAIGQIKNALGLGQAPQVSLGNVLAQPNFSQQSQPSMQGPQEASSMPQSNGLPQAPAPQPSWAENVGTYTGVTEEGKKSGELRAQDINDFSDMYYNALTKETTLNHLANTINSPEFRSIRNLPLGQQQELGYYAKFGTPEQKAAVGKFITDTGQIVKDASSDFKGQFRRGEQYLIQGMKVNDNDTIPVALGKLQSMMLFNKMLKDRSFLTSQLMSQQHLNKAKALDIADKQINISDIESQIHDQLNPTIRLRNKKTGEIVTVPIDDARKKYGMKPHGY